MATVRSGLLDIKRLSDDKLFWEEIKRFCHNCLKGENKKFCEREGCLIHFIIKQHIDKSVSYYKGILEGISRVDQILVTLREEIEKLSKKSKDKPKPEAKPKKEAKPPKIAGAEELEDDEQENELEDETEDDDEVEENGQEKEEI